MNRKIGIDHHYPEPAEWLKVSLILAVFVLPFAYKILNPIFPPLGFGVGLLGAIWCWQVFKLFVNFAERYGYQQAINDLQDLCVGRASFQTGYPSNPRDLIAAALVTLESDSSS